MDRFQQLKIVTDELFFSQPIEQHPFFTAIQNGKLSERQIKVAALQIYHVVLYFPRFLSAVLTNIPDYQTRMPLVENLFEEHGKMKEQFVHSETYRNFLLGIGLTETEIRKSEPIIPVIAYNRAIVDLCLHHHFLEGLSALGVIEEIVARVSPIVGQFARTKYGSNKEDLKHFTDHETLDVVHANEIYEVVSKYYVGDDRHLIERGLKLGMYYHRRLYTDIYEYIQNMV
jgi:pyrroloquinoline-quinone synthase